MACKCGKKECYWYEFETYAEFERDECLDCKFYNRKNKKDNFKFKNFPFQG